MFAPRSKNTASWLRLNNDIRRYGSEVKMVIWCPWSKGMHRHGHRLVTNWSQIDIHLLAHIALKTKLTLPKKGPIMKKLNLTLRPSLKQKMKTEISP